MSKEVWRRLGAVDVALEDDDPFASDDEDAELGLRLADAEPSADGVGFKAIVGELLRDAEGTPGTAERTGKITMGQVLVALDGESLLGVPRKEIEARLAARASAAAPLLSVTSAAGAAAIVATAGASAVFTEELACGAQETHRATSGGWCTNLEQLINLCLEAQAAPPPPPPPPPAAPTAVATAPSAADVALQRAEQERSIRREALAATAQEVAATELTSAELAAVETEIESLTPTPKRKRKPTLALEPADSVESAVPVPPLHGPEPEPQPASPSAAMTQLMTMGFDAPSCEAALAETNSDTARAAVLLAEGFSAQPRGVAPPLAASPHGPRAATPVQGTVVESPRYTESPRALRLETVSVSTAATPTGMSTLSPRSGGHLDDRLDEIVSPPAASPVRGVWSWFSGHDWVRYDAALSAKLEAAYQSFAAVGEAGMHSHVCDIGGGRHADFTRMRQVVTADPRRARKIQRTLESDDATLQLRASVDVRASIDSTRSRATTMDAGGRSRNASAVSWAGTVDSTRSRNVSWAADQPSEFSETVKLLQAPKEELRKKGLKAATAYAARGDQRAKLLGTAAAVQSLVQIARTDKAKKNRKNSALLLANLLTSRFDWPLADLIGVAVSGISDQRVFETAAHHVRVAYQEEGAEAVAEFQRCQGLRLYLEFTALDNRHRHFSSSAMHEIFATLYLAANDVDQRPAFAVSFEQGAIGLVGAVPRHGGEIAQQSIAAMTGLANRELIGKALAASGGLSVLAEYCGGGGEELALGLLALGRLTQHAEIAKRASAEPRLAPLLLNILQKNGSLPSKTMLSAMQLVGRICGYGDFKMRFLNKDPKSLENLRRFTVSPVVSEYPELRDESGSVLAKMLDDTQGWAARRLSGMLRTELFVYVEHYHEGVLELILTELRVRVEADSKDRKVINAKYKKVERLGPLVRLLRFDGRLARVNRLATQILSMLCADPKIRTQLQQIGIVQELVATIDKAMSEQPAGADAELELLALRQEGFAVLLRLTVRDGGWGEGSTPQPSQHALRIQQTFTKAGGISLLARVLDSSADTPTRRPEDHAATQELALRLASELSHEPTFHGEICMSGLLQCLHDMPGEAADIAMCNVAGGAIVGRASAYERLYKVATRTRESFEILLWVLEQCTRPGALAVRVAGVEAVGHLSLTSTSTQRSSGRMDEGPTMALSRLIERGVVGILTELLSAPETELVDAALETLTHLSESETDGSTFSAVPIVDAALAIAAATDSGQSRWPHRSEMRHRAIRLLCRISARNMDYAAQLWTKCGLAPVLQTAFEGTEFEVDCGQLLCIWSTWPAQLAEMTRADSAGAHSVVRTMAAFAQQVNDDQELQLAVQGFEMLLSKEDFVPVVVAEDGIIAIWKTASSEYADSDVRRRCLALLDALADGDNRARMQSDGAVLFLRNVASASSSSRQEVIDATKVLSKLGETVEEVQDGTTITMEYPEYWTPQEEEYHEVDLPRDSDEFVRIHDLLNDTLKTHASGYGCIPSTTQDPAGFEVVGIKRLQNKAQFVPYFFKKRALRSKYHGALPQYPSSQHMACFPSQMPCLDPSVNEYHLWHGTSWETVKIIKKYGLDPRVSSVMGMFGGGCYFAEDSSKSNQYIPCPQCGKGAIFRAKSEECKCDAQVIFPMVLCRVLLGDAHVVDQYDVEKYRGVDASRPVRRPPNKEGSMEAFDSILGECEANGATARNKRQRPLQFREYITYDEGCSYPEYLIMYRRSKQQQPSLAAPPMPPLGEDDGTPSGVQQILAVHATALDGSPGVYGFTIPDAQGHCEPGTQLTVTLPDGRMVAVELPPNAQPGLSLSLTLD